MFDEVVFNVPSALSEEALTRLLAGPTKILPREGDDAYFAEHSPDADLAQLAGAHAFVRSETERELWPGPLPAHETVMAVLAHTSKVSGSAWLGLRPTLRSLPRMWWHWEGTHWMKQDTTWMLRLCLRLWQQHMQVWWGEGASIQPLVRHSRAPG